MTCQRSLHPIPGIAEMLFISLFCIDDLQLRLSGPVQASQAGRTLPPPFQPFLPVCLLQPGALESNLPIFDSTKWAEQGRARHRLTVDYEQKTLGDKSSFNFSTFVILSFFTLHCHNSLSFVINYNSSSSIIVLLGKWDNIEHILCVSKRSRVFR